MNKIAILLVLALGACGGEEQGDELDPNRPGYHNGVKCGPPDGLPPNFYWVEHCDIPDLALRTNIPPDQALRFFVPDSRPWVFVEVGPELHIASDAGDRVIDPSTMAFTVSFADGLSDGSCGSSSRSPVDVPAVATMDWVQTAPSWCTFIHNTTTEYISILGFTKITDEGT